MLTVCGVILLAIGIMLYVDFCVYWSGPWKVVLSVYAGCIGGVLLIAEHPWMMGWMR